MSTREGHRRAYGASVRIDASMVFVLKVISRNLNLAQVIVIENVDMGEDPGTA